MIFALLVLSCSKEQEVYEGDLYFPLIDIGSFYGLNEKTIEKLEKSFDSIRWSKIAGKEELETIRVYDVLKANDLLESPWINLKADASIKTIYLSDEEYEKLKKFDRNKLISDNQKVELKINVTVLDSGVYYSNNISEIKLTDGKTYWRK